MHLPSCLDTPVTYLCVVSALLAGSALQRIEVVMHMLVKEKVQRRIDHEVQIFSGVNGKILSNLFQSNSPEKASNVTGWPLLVGAL